MQTRPPLSNLKTRAQAAFRFLYLDYYSAPVDNETAARDCDPVCVCNVKAGCDNVWAQCDCPWCESDGRPMPRTRCHCEVVS